MKKQISLTALLVAVLAYLWKLYAGDGCNIQNDISLKDKTVVLTGGNAGIGKSAAFDIAARGARLIIASRNVGKSEAVRAQIINETGNTDIAVMKLDLGDMNSVADFAKEILATEDHIDYLINNAGVLFMQGVTPQGYGKVFAINHLGHFLLTNLLMELLERTSESRPVKIINLTSGAYKLASLDLDNFHKEQTSSSFIDNFLHYSSTKLANIYFTRSLAQRTSDNDNITVFALHPGEIDSDIGMTVFEFYGGKEKITIPVGWSLWVFKQVITPFLKTNYHGGQTVISCMLDSEHDKYSGGYYNECRYEELPESVKDDSTAEKLWDLSMTLVKDWLTT